MKFPHTLHLILVIFLLGSNLLADFEIPRSSMKPRDSRETLVNDFPNDYADYPGKVGSLPQERPSLEPTNADTVKTDAAATVDITDAGFRPDNVTIQSGEKVMWINLTDQVQQIIGETPHRIYLPLVLYGHTSSSKTMIDAPSARSGSVQQAEWGSGDIAPGATFAFTFTEPGHYPYYLNGHPNVTGIVVVSGEAEPDFRMSISPAVQAVRQKETVTYTVAVTATNSFSGPVALSVSGLPSGTTIAWDENPATPTTRSVLVVTTTLSTPIGTYGLAVRGQSGGISHTVEAVLDIEPALPDLVVHSVDVEPSHPYLNDPITLTINVANEGGASESPFRVDWYADLTEPPDPGHTGEGFWILDPLDVGEDVSLVVTYTMMVSGMQWLYAQADTLNQVDESDELNNIGDPAGVTVIGHTVDMCGHIAVDTTWRTGILYRLTCDVTVDADVTLDLEQGTVVKFTDSADTIAVYGTLDAQGTSSSQVVFTSDKDDSYGGDTNEDGSASSPAPGDWSRIYILDVGEAFLKYVTIKYGGHRHSTTYPNGSIYLRDEGDLVLQNSTIASGGSCAIGGYNIAGSITVSNTIITDNTGDGIYLYGSEIDLPTLVDNTFSNNSGQAMDFRGLKPLIITGADGRISGNTGWNNNLNGIQFYAERYTGSPSIHFSSPDGEVVLANNPNLPYVFPNAPVYFGESLRIEPGTVLKIQGQSLFSDRIVAEGQKDAPIVFTSLNDDDYGGDTHNDGSLTSPTPGDWRGLETVNGYFDYAVLRYGGHAGHERPIIDASGNVTINLWLNHSEIRGSAYHGIGVTNSDYTATLTVKNSTLSGNLRRGIDMAANSSGRNNLTVLSSVVDQNGRDGISIELPNQLILSDTIFVSNGGFVMAAYGLPGIEYSQVRNNVALSNTHNAIHLDGSVSGESFLNRDIPYVINELTIHEGATLTVEPGAILKFRPSAGLGVGGTLLAQGTADSLIYFTSYVDDSVGGDTNADGSASSPAPSDWEFIDIQNSGEAELQHSVVRYGGDSHYGPPHPNASIQVGSDSKLVLTHSEVTFSGSDAVGGYYTTGTITISQTNFVENTKGIHLYGDVISLPTLIDNIFINNRSAAAYFSGYGSPSIINVDGRIRGNTGSGNGFNGIEFNARPYAGGARGTVHLSGVDDVVLLAPNPGLPYVFQSCNGGIASELLRIEPGTVFKMRGANLNADRITADGEKEAPVVFTSLDDDAFGGDTNDNGAATSPAAGDWMGIHLSEAIFDHVRVTYGGYHLNPSLQRAVDVSQFMTMTNSIVAYNLNTGIYIEGNALIENSAIFENQHLGVWNDNTSVVVTAKHNDWGHPSGPAPYGSANGINYTRSCSGDACVIVPAVDVIPWEGYNYWVKHHQGQSIPWQAYESDPVNTATGNYAYQYTDLSIATRGMPLDFTRAYNSVSPEDGPLGFGWTHSWRLSASENITDEIVYITYGDGSMDQFAWDGQSYEPDPGTFSTLVKNGDGTFDMTQKDQTVYHFDATGHLTWIADRNGNTTTLAYTGDQLTAVTGPSGRALTFTYEGVHLVQVADPLGRAVRFGYDGLGNLTVVTDTRGFATTYAFDADHRLLSITDANSHTFVTNVYNDDGRVVSQFDAQNNEWTFAYDEPDHDTIVTDPLGRTTTYDYDAEYRLINQEDALGHSVGYTYDQDNNRTSVEDKRGYVTAYAYDDRGNVTVITDALSFTRTFTYDTRNNLIGRTDPLGYTTVYTYDTQSNLTDRADPLGNLTRWAYDAYGQVVSHTDALNRTTLFAYDAYGYQTAITDTLGNATIYAYDIAGRMLSETDSLGRTITYTYDAANHLLTISEPLDRITTYTYDAVGNRTFITDPRGGITTFGYDAKDRLVNVTDPLSHTTTFGYDAVDNETAVTDPLGHTTAFGYDALNRRTSVTDPLGNTTSYQYDPNGNRISMTDANGNVTQYGYDPLNRLVSVTDAEGGTVIYAYDVNGNRTSMVDANGHKTIYAYDALNRLLSTTDPLSYTTTFSYDAVGNRIGKTRPDATNIDYTYDALDRLATISYPGGTIGYAYDAIGNRSVMTDTAGVTTYAYDALDRLTQVTAPNGTLQYGYDLNDNRTNLTYPDGEVVTYTYDLADRLTTVTDWAGRTTTYTYDDTGRQTAVQHPNGTQAAYSYDDADRLLSILHTSPVSDTIAVFTYTLDNVGNRLTMEDLEGTTSYAYDDLYRLTQVGYPGGEEVTYSYDPMGNRTAMTSTVSGVVTYTYDAGDRLWAAGQLTFTWDANGNMTGKGAATYTFDALDRLTQVVSGTTSVQFAYDGDGTRLNKTVDAATTTYVQDVAAPLPVVLAETADGQTSRYVYGNDLLAQMDSADNPVFYHYDGLGSTRALSNLAGQRTDAYSYDVFGAVRSRAGNTAQPFAFTGEQLDGRLELVYLRARYYDPSIGRFLSRDSFPGYEEKIQSVNRYVYVGNHPTGRIDPSGHDAIGDARRFLLNLSAQVRAVPKLSREDWKDALTDVTDQEFWNRAARGMDDAVNFIRTPSRILEEKAQRATGFKRMAYQAGGLIWDALPPISVSTAFYSSISADIKLLQGNISGQDFAGIQAESVSSLFFDYLGDLPNKVPGRYPHFGTRAFFLGKHTQRHLLELLYDITSEYTSRRIGDLTVSLYDIVTGWHDGGFDNSWGKPPGDDK